MAHPDDMNSMINNAKPVNLMPFSFSSLLLFLPSFSSLLLFLSFSSSDYKLTLLLEPRSTTHKGEVLLPTIV